MKKGFTLIELMVVISIIALFSAVGFNLSAEARSKAQDAKKISEIDQVEKAIAIHKESIGRVPKNYNCNGSYCAGGGGTLVAIEGSQAYNASMQELVSGGYLGAIPKSSDGTYTFYSDTTGQVASFGTTLKSAASSGKTGNSCSIISSSTYQKCVGLDSGGGGAKWATSNEGSMNQTAGSAACIAKGMRLPTGLELQAHYQAGLPSGGFSGTNYWASDSGGMGKAGYVNMTSGTGGYHPQSISYSIRCVQ